jgi:hypothetical protein
MRLPQPPVAGFFNKSRAVARMPSAILFVSIVNVPSAIACLIDSTCATSMSASPDAASERSCADSPDRLTLVSPPAPGADDGAPAPAVAAPAAAWPPARVPGTPPLGAVRLEVVVESTFTMASRTIAT